MKTKIVCDAATFLAALCLSVTIVASVRAQTRTVTATSSQSTSSPKEAIMTARGAFDVKITPQDDKLNDGISRMVIDKQYHGDLEGTSKGQMLATGSAKSSGVYVAIETFTGTLQGGSGEKKTGSFSLHHTGIMTKSGPSLSISVVPDSGTGQLAGISGKMNIVIAPDGKHSYEFEYTLPAQ
jgi:hypothetical protein